jgi:LPS O-antigen subunit length determinant protein (WzzB/FepE family)
MKKNSPLLHDEEIDLTPLFKIIWNGKKKIVLITIISFLIGFGYIYQLPNKYIYSLVIKPSQNSEFIKFSSILKLIENNQTSKINPKNEINLINNNLINNKEVLDRFIDELNDYEEFLFILKDNLKGKDKENISKLPIYEVKKALFKYIDLLEIIRPNKGETDFILNLKWNNNFKEATDILQNIINLVINNLEKKFYQDLNENLEMKKNFILLESIQRLQYLSEQSLIAKEIGISNEQLKELNLSSIVNLDYLRGYQAIDMAISLIKKRDNEEINFILNKIISLKKVKTDWISYDIDSVNPKLIRETRSILLISVLLGLVIGVLYVIISNTFHFQAVFKKKSN